MHDTASRSNVIISGGIFIFAQTTIGWASYGPVIIAGVKINTFSDSRKTFSKKIQNLNVPSKPFYTIGRGGTNFFMPLEFSNKHL